MNPFFKWGLLGLLTIVGIFLLSNISNLFINLAPDRIMIRSAKASLHEVSEKLPGTKVAGEEESILIVPYGYANEYMDLAVKTGMIYSALPVRLEKPEISFHYYGISAVKQLKGYLHGDLGQISTRRGDVLIPITSVLADMAKRTAKYFISGLLTAVILAIVLSMLASMGRGFGKIMDGLHGLLLGLPDFMLIVLIQLGAVYLYRATGKRMILIVHFGTEVPFLIPFLSIMLIPTVMIYGTLRLAIRREMARDYVVTARSKGLSRWEVLRSHVFRNVIEDLLAIMPKATTTALASMAIAEAICDILGLGGIIVSPRFQALSAMPAACMVLVAIAILFHALYALLRKRFVVRTREAV